MYDQRGEAMVKEIFFIPGQRRFWHLDIKMREAAVVALEPLEIFGRPYVFPELDEGEDLLCIIQEPGAGLRLWGCDTLEDMQDLYKKRIRNRALRAHWFRGKLSEMNRSLAPTK